MRMDIKFINDNILDDIIDNDYFRFMKQWKDKSSRSDTIEIKSIKNTVYNIDWNKIQYVITYDDSE